MFFIHASETAAVFCCPPMDYTLHAAPLLAATGLLTHRLTSRPSSSSFPALALALAPAVRSLPFLFPLSPSPFPAFLSVPLSFLCLSRPYSRLYPAQYSALSPVFAPLNMVRNNLRTWSPSRKCSKSAAICAFYTSWPRSAHIGGASPRNTRASLPALRASDGVRPTAVRPGMA